jgi:hypothetical protein
MTCPEHQEVAMQKRGGPPRPVGDLFTTAGVLAHARANAGVTEAPTRSSETAPPDAGEGPLNDGKENVREEARARPGPVGNKAPLERPEPAANSPEDIGFNDLTNHVKPAPAAPLHEPKTCTSCGAPILWAQVLQLDEHGRWSRVKNPDTGRMKSMPVDFQPDPLKGNVVLFHREAEGIVCRVLKQGEEPPPGARLRTSHFATCPNANQHRRPGRRGARR